MMIPNNFAYIGVTPIFVFYKSMFIITSNDYICFAMYNEIHTL